VSTDEPAKRTTGKAWKGRIVVYRDEQGRDRWRREEPPVDQGPQIGSAGVLEGRRPARVGEVPLGAQRLAERAARASWRGAVTYARGWRYARRGRPAKVVPVEVHSVAVRLAHPSGWRAVAVWENGDTVGAWLWLPAGRGPYQLPHDVGVAAVTQWIKAGGRLTVAQAIEVSARES
jgi:hypothetical protein